MKGDKLFDTYARTVLHGIESSRSPSTRPTRIREAKPNARASLQAKLVNDRGVDMVRRFNIQWYRPQTRFELVALDDETRAWAAEVDAAKHLAALANELEDFKIADEPPAWRGGLPPGVLSPAIVAAMTEVSLGRAYPDQTIEVRAVTARPPVP